MSSLLTSKNPLYVAKLSRSLELNKITLDIVLIMPILMKGLIIIFLATGCSLSIVLLGFAALWLAVCISSVLWPQIAFLPLEDGLPQLPPLGTNFCPLPQAKTLLFYH